MACLLAGAEKLVMSKIKPTRSRRRKVTSPPRRQRPSRSDEADRQDVIRSLETILHELSESNGHEYSRVEEESLMPTAIALHQQGALRQAATLYRQQLSLDRDHADALHLLGLVEYALGNIDEGFQWMERAVQVDPNCSNYHLNRGLAYLEIGDNQKAADAFRRDLTLQPESCETMHVLGLALCGQGQVQEGAHWIERALLKDQGNAGYWVNLALAYIELGSIELAEKAALKARSLDAQLATAHEALGSIAKAQGDFPRSLEAYSRAIELDDHFAVAWANKGDLFVQQAKYQDALPVLERAVELAPNLPEARRNLAYTQFFLGDTKLAFDNFIETIKLAPEQLASWNVMIDALSIYGDSDGVRSTLCELASQRQEAIHLLAAEAHCPPILQDADSIDHYCESLHRAIRRASHPRLPSDPMDLATTNLQFPYYASYHGTDITQLRCDYADLFTGQIQPLPSQTQEGPPKLCFSVGLDREGVFLKFNQGLIQQLAGSELQVAIAANRRSISMIRKRLGDHVQYVPVTENVAEAAQAIHAQNPSVLFHFEPGCDGPSYFLPFYQAAPVQVTSWGLPITSGNAAMNYFLTSELIEPQDGAEHYCEQAVMMPTLPVYYQSDAKVTPVDRPDRGQFGLPESGNLYGCVQSLFKYHPDFDQYLGQILQADPEAHLVLAGSIYLYYNEQIMQRLRRTIPNAEQRITMLPRLPYSQCLHLMQCCDVLLDTVYFAGGATSYEAFSLGVPIVTMPGRFMRGRVTDGLYQKMGISDCSVSGRDAYVAKAIQIANEPDYRQHIKEQLLERSACLFEDQSAVRLMEAFFLEAGS